MQVLVLLSGLRLEFCIFEVKILDEHILCVDSIQAIIISFLTKMTFRGFCIETLQI